MKYKSKSETKKAFFMNYSGRKICVPVKNVGFFRRGIGLMFRTRETGNLLFSFARPCRVAITSWFVFFPFAAVWLDERKRVLEFRIVKPFTFSLKPRFPSAFLLELPCNQANLKVISSLVGK